MFIRLLSFLLIVIFSSVSCGGESINSTLNGLPMAPADTGTGANFNESANIDNSPFEGLTTGDPIPWGQFIRGEYRTTNVRDLPILVYCALFSEKEKEEIYAGIDMTNEAIGFEVFRPVEDYDSKVRVIYKVSKIEFEGENADPSLANAVGYTFALTIFPYGKKQSGRVVVDWAMELTKGGIHRYVVAHELGHAMGIQEHSMINYETGQLENLEPNSLMAAVISNNPVLDDYIFMMEKQGEMLVDYISR